MARPDHRARCRAPRRVDPTDRAPGIGGVIEQVSVVRSEDRRRLHDPVLVGSFDGAPNGDPSRHLELGRQLARRESKRQVVRKIAFKLEPLELVRIAVIVGDLLDLDPRRERMDTDGRVADRQPNSPRRRPFEIATFAAAQIGPIDDLTLDLHVWLTVGGEVEAEVDRALLEFRDRLPGFELLEQLLLTQRSAGGFGVGVFATGHAPLRLRIPDQKIVARHLGPPSSDARARLGLHGSCHSGISDCR